MKKEVLKKPSPGIFDKKTQNLLEFKSSGKMHGTWPENHPGSAAEMGGKTM